MGKWKVREATDDERIYLARTERTLFDSGSPDPQWLFDRNPMGKGLVLVAEGPDGKPAGTRAMVPWDLLVDGEIVRLGQYARSWTDPRYRNQGVSVAIGNALNAAAADLGYPLIFLFPSVRSIPGHRRIGNRVDTLLQRRQVVLRLGALREGWPGLADPLLRALWRIRLSRGSGVWRPVADLTTEAAPVWERVRAHPPARVIGIRDETFVGWRYGGGSGHRYQGWRFPETGPARLLAVTVAAGNRIRLADVWGTEDPPETARALVSLFRELSLHAGFLEWCPPVNGAWPRMAGSLALLKRRDGVPIARWFVAPESTLGALADLGNYGLTEGDSDYL